MIDEDDDKDDDDDRPMRGFQASLAKYRSLRFVCRRTRWKPDPDRGHSAALQDSSALRN